MNKYIYRILLALVTLVLSACVNEMDFAPNAEGGRLRLSLANISTATTRTSPHDLGKPSAEDFRLRILNASGRAVYDDLFTTEEITLPVGDYTVLATYGSNTLLALDQPYYVGQTTATVRKDDTAEASITARVGNALVSVNFGGDSEEHARFERFFSEYALQVYVGNYSMELSKDNPLQSVYVQAGSHVTLKFHGTLREGDREISCDLASDDFPETLNAADHAIITLSLPKNVLAVDISKVEVETVTLDETIPLSWLPVPTLTPSLQFDPDNRLVGTLLTSTNGYPGMNWKAVVTNADGVEVRTMQGSGVLTSDYAASAEWPYLPQGMYKAIYYIISEDGSAKQASSREFNIPAPTGLAVTLTGYTSYSKYLEGDIEAANACDRSTVYEPSVSVNVAPALLNNSHVSYSFTYTYDGTRYSVVSGSNSYGMDKLEGQVVRANTYVLRGDFTFDGTSFSNQTEFRITGLPALYEPPTEGNEWSAGSEYVTFSETELLLGKRGVPFTHHNEFATNNDFYIPFGTRMVLDYDIMIHPATEGTTFSAACGSQAILMIDQNGGLGDSSDHPYRGTSNVLTASSNITQMTCTNSYGGGETCTHIYSLQYKYAE